MCIFFENIVQCFLNGFDSYISLLNQIKNNSINGIQWFAKNTCFSYISIALAATQKHCDCLVLTKIRYFVSWMQIFINKICIMRASIVKSAQIKIRSYFPNHIMVKHQTETELWWSADNKQRMILTSHNWSHVIVFKSFYLWIVLGAQNICYKFNRQ